MASLDRTCIQDAPSRAVGGCNDASGFGSLCCRGIALFALLSISQSFAGSVAYVPWEYQRDDFSRANNELLVIDLDGGNIAKSVVLDWPEYFDEYRGATSVAVLPTGDRVWVENPYRESIDVYDTSNMERVHRIPLPGKHIHQLLPDPRGHVVYVVSNFESANSFSVLEIDPATMARGRTFDTNEAIEKLVIDPINSRLLVLYLSRYVYQTGEPTRMSTRLSLLSLDALQVLNEVVMVNAISSVEFDETYSEILLSLDLEQNISNSKPAVCKRRASDFQEILCVDAWRYGGAGWGMVLERERGVLASFAGSYAGFFQSTTLQRLGRVTVQNFPGVIGFDFSVDGELAIVLTRSHNNCEGTFPASGPPCPLQLDYQSEVTIWNMRTMSQHALISWGRGRSRVEGHSFVGPNRLHTGHARAVPTFSGYGGWVLSTLVLFMVIIVWGNRGVTEDTH